MPGAFVFLLEDHFLGFAVAAADEDLSFGRSGLFAVKGEVFGIGRRLKLDWEYLQSSDHFYYMATGKNAAGPFSPYDSPFAAFTNYMNVLADFIVRVEEQYPEEIGNEELNSLLLTIRNQAAEIESLNKEVKTLRQNILTADDTVTAPVAVDVLEKADVESPATAKAASAPDAVQPAPRRRGRPRKTDAETAPAKPGKAAPTRKKSEK